MTHRVACTLGRMIHGYHVIFGAYGFWLPNDPRGSWSDFVGSWEISRYGKATRSIVRKTLTEREERQRLAAKQALLYSPVEFNTDQVACVARGFAKRVQSSGITVWACSILPCHVHLVIARHTYDVEQISNLLKGEATKQLRKEGFHPLGQYAGHDTRPPSPWADRRWKVFLDSTEAIERAIDYVEENPVKEGKTEQNWSFVESFRGLDEGWVTYY